MIEKPMGRNVTIEDTSEVLCDKCKTNVFSEAVLLRKVSALLTGAAKDAYIPVPVFQCQNCGSVNQEFIPAELRTKIVSA
jgi:uncharacterized Zn finger protein